MTVTELNEYLKNVFDSMPKLENVYIRGELSNYKVYPSGHCYFTLKDAGGALRCVMFRSSAAYLRFRPRDGMRVIAFGRVTVYPRDGAYQLYVSSITPDGVGDLQIAFEQLKEKLFREGLFDEAHKRPLPAFPMRVGVVTSPAGAAVHDIIEVLGKRWPVAKILLLPTRVQGEEAPPEIAAAIRYAGEYRVADVLIVGRGGGSMEDLWCFNDERVARAIYDSAIPVISGVGHDPDVTIADLVADVRAATPSNAAEKCSPDIRELRGAVRDYAVRAAGSIEKRLKRERERLEAYAGRRVLQDPKNIVDVCRQTLDMKSERLYSLMSAALAEARRGFTDRAARLDAMSPLKVLGRGYAIAVKSDGKVVRTTGDVKSGDEFTLRLQKGGVECVVK